MSRPPTLVSSDHGIDAPSPTLPFTAPGLVNGCFKLLEAVMAALLVAMVVMVLGNVILRYGFNTGISASEELSRTFFIWLTFIGAVVAVRDRSHLGIDSLLLRLPRAGQIALLTLSELLILTCCALVLWGTWAQHEINATSTSLITGMPLIWVFGIGYVMGGGIGLLTLHRLWRLLSGRASHEEIFGPEPWKNATPGDTK